MKLEDVQKDLPIDFKVDDLDLILEFSAADAGDLQDLKNLDKSYDEIRMLHTAITKKDFGIIIDKKGKKLDYNDIQAIKIRLNEIFSSNTFFRNRINNEKDFQVSMRQVGHRVEAFLLTAFAGLFAISSIINPLGPVLSLGSYLLGKRSSRIADAIKTSSSVLNVAASFRKMGELDKGRAKRIEKLIKDKDVRELKKSVKQDAKRLKGEINSKFLKDFKKLPSHIEYYDKNGEKQLYPIEKLFV